MSHGTTSNKAGRTRAGKMAPMIFIMPAGGCRVEAANRWGNGGCLKLGGRVPRSGMGTVSRSRCCVSSSPEWEGRFLSRRPMTGAARGSRSRHLCCLSTRRPRPRQWTRASSISPAKTPGPSARTHPRLSSGPGAFPMGVPTQLHPSGGPGAFLRRATSQASNRLTRRSARPCQLDEHHTLGRELLVLGIGYRVSQHGAR